ncbi:MAG TPA: outer membrane protein assembly factor BamD [Salinimicrobium sp.]|nr:outer membrane protein assembly factor BamD [Salinimicrobium sp.]
MKKGILLIGLVLLAVSCSEYQKILKSDDVGLKYTTAEQLYEEAEAGEGNVDRKYRRALRLFEQIVPEYRGKPQAQKLMYLYADTYYEMEDYYLAGYQFERFVESYPQSEKVEEAAFKGAKSYFFLSPPYYLDQSDTKQGIDKLQSFINRFPESEKLDQANELIAKLRLKLEKKEFEIAKGYHHRRDYRAAITSFGNFLENFPGSTFTEEAQFYQFDSAYQYAINSYRYAMEERLTAAEDYFEEYKEDFPEGKFLEKAQPAITDINTRLQTFNSQAK